jgi:hypothetical protein
MYGSIAKYEILHLHYYEHDTIDEIVKYFDGKISKYDINNVLNLSNDEHINIMHSQIQSMTDQVRISN